MDVARDCYNFSLPVTTVLLSFYPWLKLCDIPISDTRNKFTAILAILLPSPMIEMGIMLSAAYLSAKAHST